MRVFLVAALLLAMTGCGSSTNTSPVAGQLLLDGKPLTNILVTFIPEIPAQDAGQETRIRSMAMTDAEGKFRLRTETQVDGALIGTHKVILEDLAILNAPRSENGTVIKMPEARFPDRYKSIVSSTLKAQVSAGPNLLKLEIQSQ